MPLVVRAKKNQRIYIGDIVLEISFDKGQFKAVFFSDKKPLPYKISRETLEEYNFRKSSYQGGKRELRHCGLHSVSVSATAR